MESFNREAMADVQTDSHREEKDTYPPRETKDVCEPFLHHQVMHLWNIGGGDISTEKQITLLQSCVSGVKNRS
jgi:hypothetical protein